MKRILSVALVMVPVLLAPVTAFAQEGSGLNPPQGPSIGGAGGSIGGTGGAGGTPFTGAEVAQLIALAVALVVVGVAALLLTRRRRAAQVEA
jgi:LPXTG-motif cell wall-anchored protein